MGVRQLDNGGGWPYQCLYLSYTLTGAANVVVYGVLHWDQSCWRQRSTAQPKRSVLSAVGFNSSLDEERCFETEPDTNSIGELRTETDGSDASEGSLHSTLATLALP